MYVKPNYEIEEIETEDIITTSAQVGPSLDVGEYVDPITGDPVQSVTVSIDVENLL